jgi:small subunit ribosomal protein S6
MNMNNYEAMFIIKPDLKEDERQALTKAIKEQVTRHEGVVVTDQMWAERRRLAYDIFPSGGGLRIREGMYYLVNFESVPSAITTLKAQYGLNENILRFLILRVEAPKVSV